jgi:hypothetical protein
MSIRKRSKLSRGTHQLKSAKGGMNEHTEWKQVIEGHSPTGECKGRDE